MVLETVPAPAPVPQMISASDILNMSMMEWAEFRRKETMFQDLKDYKSYGLYGPVTKTPYDKYLDAREAYANGTGTLDDMLKYVRLEDKDKYDAVYQHREPRRGWTSWWRLRGRHR